MSGWLPLHPVLCGVFAGISWLALLSVLALAHDFQVCFLFLMGSDTQHFSFLAPESIKATPGDVDPILGL